MEFAITKTYQYTYTFKVVQVSIDQDKEVYDVIARNKTVRFKSNQPLLRRKGLKHRKPNWDIIEGEIKNPGFRDKII